MTHDEMIAIIQAHKEGKIVEYKWSWSESTDYPCECTITHQFNFVDNKYRIKREPRRIYQNEYLTGDLGDFHESEEKAKVAAKGNIVNVIEFVEVLK